MLWLHLVGRSHRNGDVRVLRGVLRNRLLLMGHLGWCRRWRLLHYLVLLLLVVLFRYVSLRTHSLGLGLLQLFNEVLELLPSFNDMLPLLPLALQLDADHVSLLHWLLLILRWLRLIHKINNREFMRID